MQASLVLDHLRASPLGLELAVELEGAAGLSELRDEAVVEPFAGHLLRLFRVYDDALAFEFLIELTQRHLRNQAQRLCRQLRVLLDPDDLVATFMARLFTDIRRDQPIVHRFFGMSYRTMRFEALNQLRLDRRARKRGELWESMKVLDARAHDPARTVSDEESARTVARLGLILVAITGQCFHTLHARDRQILWLREIEGYDYDRLAEAVEKPRKQIGMVLKRAREKLARGIDAALLSHMPHGASTGNASAEVLRRNPAQTPHREMMPTRGALTSNCTPPHQEAVA